MRVELKDWPVDAVLPGKDITLRVAGKMFQCGCGANVFRNPDGEPEIYRCNGCDAEYEADD